jgi:hypothetical protein
MSCSSQQKDKEQKGEMDIFYERSGGWDYARIPLKKPYELMKLKNGNTWDINLHAMTLQSSISNVMGVNVIDGIIVIHSTKKTILRGSEVSEAWFVIIPEKEIEKGFDNQNDFTAYASSVGIKEIKFYSPDIVYQSFMKKWPIDWEKDFL